MPFEKIVIWISSRARIFLSTALNTLTDDNQCMANYLSRRVSRSLTEFNTYFCPMQFVLAILIYHKAFTSYNLIFISIAHFCMPSLKILYVLLSMDIADILVHQRLLSFLL